MIAYAGIIVVAVAAAALLARRTQRGLDLPPHQKLAIAWGAFCGAMIGAKLPFVFSDWGDFLSGAAWFSNGKTILLGLVGGYCGVEVAKWCFDVRVRTGDGFAVPVATAVAIGRLGCFVAGCCHGTPTELPWGVVFSQVDQVARHPTQLYEFAFHAACAVGLAYCHGRQWFRGNLIKLYIILYAVYRFATELIRPEIQLWGGLTGYQWASLVLVLLFGWLWWRTPSLPLLDAEKPAGIAFDGGRSDTAL